MPLTDEEWADLQHKANDIIALTGTHGWQLLTAYVNEHGGRLQQDLATGSGITDWLDYRTKLARVEGMLYVLNIEKNLTAELAERQAQREQIPDEDLTL